MATPTLVSVRDFTNSRYAQLAESSDSLNMSDVLASAEEIIQRKLGNKVLSATYTEVVSKAGSQVLFMPVRPMTAVTQVRRKLISPWSAWETLDPATYFFEDGPGYVEVRGVDIFGFDVEVTYTAGYAETPLGIKEAILLQAVLLSAQDFETYGTGDSRSPGYVGYMNADIDKWLAPYRSTASVYR